MDELQDPNFVRGLIGAGLFLVLLGLSFNWLIGRQQKRLRPENPREIAEISEDVRLTWVGAMSLLMIILTIGFGAYANNHAKTVFQQIDADVTVICCFILFGLGVALGRRRTYRVFRAEERKPD